MLLVLLATLIIPRLKLLPILANMLPALELRPAIIKLSFGILFMLALKLALPPLLTLSFPVDFVIFSFSGSELLGIFSSTFRGVLTSGEIPEFPIISLVSTGNFSSESLFSWIFLSVTGDD